MRLKIRKMLRECVVVVALCFLGGSAQAIDLETSEFRADVQMIIYDKDAPDSRVDMNTDEVCLRLHISNKRQGFRYAPMVFHDMVLTNVVITPVSDGAIDLPLSDLRAVTFGTEGEHGHFRNVVVKELSDAITPEACFEVTNKDDYWNILTYAQGLYIAKVRMVVNAGYPATTSAFEFVQVLEINAAAVVDDGTDGTGDDGDTDDDYGFSCKNKGHYGYACKKDKVKDKDFHDYYKRYNPHYNQSKK